MKLNYFQIYLLGLLVFLIGCNKEPVGIELDEIVPFPGKVIYQAPQYVADDCSDYIRNPRFVNSKQIIFTKGTYGSGGDHSDILMFDLESGKITSLNVEYGTADYGDYKNNILVYYHQHFSYLGAPGRIYYPDKSIAKFQGYRPSFNSDGSAFVFENSGGLYTYNLADSSIIGLSQNGWSPDWDNDEIYFCKRVGIKTKIFSVFSNGENPQQMTNEEGSDYHPRTSNGIFTYYNTTNNDTTGRQVTSLIIRNTKNILFKEELIVYDPDIWDNKIVYVGKDDQLFYFTWK